MTSPTETPAPKVVCESKNCGKEYASRGGIKNHLKKSHKAVEIQSPLGKFPASDPAGILFNDDGEPSTQGNSSGQVNSPKFSSVGQYSKVITHSLNLLKSQVISCTQNIIVNLH